jgi:HSP20 family protein
LWHPGENAETVFYLSIKESIMKNKAKQGTAVSPSSSGAKKTSPVRALGPIDEIERFFENWIPADWLRSLAQERSLLNVFPAQFELKAPNIDIVDLDTEIVVRAEVPGVDKKNLDISINGRSLTIKGSSESKSEEEKGDYYRCEISQGSFTRTVRLPEEVDGRAAKSTFKDGLLELRLPKTEKSRRQTIKVG